MVNRSANATIKGYFYQFDYAILKALESSGDAEFVVEGIEDVDISDATGENYVQCKYYEGTEYNHSVIKEAVQFMVRHFCENMTSSAASIYYKIYGHYKAGHGKLVGLADRKAQLSVDFLKTNFLTYSESGVERRVHDELGMDDFAIQRFLNVFVLDIWAVNYDEQFELIKNKAAQYFCNCQGDDFHDFFYPNAINFIRERAIQKDISRRRFKRQEFFDVVDKKEGLFNKWLFQYRGVEKYCSIINRQFFKFGVLNIPKRARVFVIEGAGRESVDTVVELLDKIARKFSHREKERTVDVDRFCPFVYFSEMENSHLAAIKERLKESGVKFIDGYDFKGAKFCLKSIMRTPTKENLWRLKIINSQNELDQVVGAAHGCIMDVFHFYFWSNGKYDLGFGRLGNYKPIGVDRFETIGRTLV